MKRILIAPNSFKGSADSVAAAEYFRKHLNDKNFELLVKPISDGGDGFLNVCKKHSDLREVRYSFSTPYDESKLLSPAGYDDISGTLYIESAKVLGLDLIPSSKRNPLRLSSHGIGDLLINILNDARTNKIVVNKVFIGIGGTGTNDLGMGALSRFGMKLFDSQDNELKPLPENYRKAKDLEWNHISLPFGISCVVDVENPLLGVHGASRVFARQKGASSHDIEIMEEGFNNIINICYEKKMIPEDKFLPGAGGGLAAGLSIFLKAEILTAEEFIMKHLGFEILKGQIDFLVTGEGSFDSQSMMKKGAWILCMNFLDSAEKIFLCCGTIESEIKSSLNPKIIPFELTSFFDNREDSIINIEKGIKSAADEIRKYASK